MSKYDPNCCLGGKGAGSLVSSQKSLEKLLIDTIYLYSSLQKVSRLPSDLARFSSFFKLSLICGVNFLKVCGSREKHLVNLLQDLWSSFGVRCGVLVDFLLKICLCLAYIVMKNFCRKELLLL